MADDARIIALLTSIDASLQHLVAVMSDTKPAARERPAFVPVSPSPARSKPHATLAVAPDSDLDSKYGDEVIRFDPRDWHGEHFKGCHMSEAPAAYLDLLAESLEYFARKNEETGATTDKGKPKADYDRRSAARARGWAARARARQVDHGRPATDVEDEDSIPF